MRHQRHLDIVHRLRSDGAASVDELARSLKVSEATIRRDLHRLDATGQITRVHGGAVASAAGTRDPDLDRPFVDAATSDLSEKRAVARRAAALIADGDVLLLDIGTTTQLLAWELRSRRVTVMTASLAVLDVLREATSVDLILLGGLVRPAYHSLVGVLTEDALRAVHADLAFLGASGVRQDGEVLDTSLVEVPVKRALMRAADRSVLLADRHKFPGTGSLRICGIADLDVLVTNEGADPASLQTCSDLGVEVLTA